MERVAKEIMADWVVAHINRETFILAVAVAPVPSAEMPQAQVYPVLGELAVLYGGRHMPKAAMVLPVEVLRVRQERKTAETVAMAHKKMLEPMVVRVVPESSLSDTSRSNRMCTLMLEYSYGIESIRARRTGRNNRY
jgi:hypothetical protein